MKKFDITAHCNKTYKAGTILENILNKKDNEFIRVKVSTHIYRFQTRIKALDNIAIKHRQYFVDFLIKDSIKNIKLCEFPVEVETHLLNVICGLYKKKLKQINKIKHVKV